MALTFFRKNLVLNSDMFFKKKKRQNQAKRFCEELKSYRYIYLSLNRIISEFFPSRRRLQAFQPLRE